MPSQNPWATKIHKPKSGIKPPAKPGRLMTSGKNKSLFLRKSSFLHGFMDELQKSSAQRIGFGPRVARGAIRFGMSDDDEKGKGDERKFVALVDPILERVKAYKRYSQKLIADRLLSSPGATGGGAA